jgi:hypothetical protein
VKLLREQDGVVSRRQLLGTDPIHVTFGRAREILAVPGVRAHRTA